MGLPPHRYMGKLGPGVEARLDGAEPHPPSPVAPEPWWPMGFGFDSAILRHKRDLLGEDFEEGDKRACSHV